MLCIKLLNSYTIHVLTAIKMQSYNHVFETKTKWQQMKQANKLIDNVHTFVDL